MIKLSIIIVNWNTAELLRQCLNSLVKSSKCKVQSEIIVVDNGSTDSSVELVQSSRQMGGQAPFKVQSCSLKLKVIQNKENLGFAKGNNIGVKEATGEYIMLLNTDTVVKEGAIEKLVDFLDSHREIGIVGPRLLNQDGSPQANCGKFPNLWVSFVMLFKEHFGGSDTVRFSPTESQKTDWLMGAAFIARKEVFDKAGGFDEEIFMYMEEVEWFYRTKKLGFTTYFLKDAEITHLGRGSSKSGKKEPIINIYKGVLHFYKVHKTRPEVFLILAMLKFKALLALTVGILKNDNYLKETYGEAVKIS